MKEYSVYSLPGCPSGEYLIARQLQSFQSPIPFVPNSTILVPFALSIDLCVPK